ncbi:valyl-tRNA synthetase [Polymorphobacter fuscus]|nr:valyl-tRNA synthetase [Polymorphobacter fuscus]
MGRARFLETVWDWKRESGGTITQQLRRLGASCDWAHERFTMDEGFNTAVTRVFVTLYNQGLLYRDKRLVNWDPKLKTAISDLEVEFREVEGNLWHFRYPLEDGSGFIAIATTRPETILGDGAVAVNPDDPKMAHYVGKRCRLPLVDRLIPIITDSYVEADFGSGAVKITAAHDFNDFEVYKRHPEADIPVINLMNPDGTMSDACPEAYRGLTREDARKKVVADFEALGLLDKIEPHRHQVPYGDRSGVVIEPYLTDQWYVNAAELAKPALAAVRSGETQFVPKTWEKTYFNWMENIQPWCVSRQLWWGHQIPAWYGPSKDELERRSTQSMHEISRELFSGVKSEPNCFVAETAADALQQAQEYYGPEWHVADASGAAWETIQGDSQLPTLFLTRDEDVLDTWFSSALWPFATLGWPDETPDLARHYPGDVLVTGFDIIFFWVARMMMQGLHFMDDVPPFKTVYCHGLVRDAKGAKMSKSKGNTVDPLVLVDKYGADALRFTLTAMESQGRDIKLDEKRVEGYRNFATKLWNAARFCQSNGISGSTSIAPPPAQNAVNRWIIGEVAATARALETAIQTFRFDAYADTIYSFAWNRFCDWYLELTKPLLAEGADAGVAAETRAVSGWALDQILVMLHPVMPFLTEELWHKLGTRTRDLIVSDWVAADLPVDADASADIEWLISAVTGIRTAKSDLGIAVRRRLPALMIVNSVDAEFRANRCQALVETLAGVGFLGGVYNELVHGQGGSQNLLTSLKNKHGFSAIIEVVSSEALFVMDVGDAVDLAAERARLEKAIATAVKERDALAGRLASPGFTEKAKPEAVEKAREDHAARSAEAERLAAALARLG